MHWSNTSAEGSTDDFRHTAAVVQTSMANAYQAHTDAEHLHELQE